ncbi:MAG TPA: Hsp70 family protein [Polyangia bacterium]|nr:Hsp70 family protein [Polyangia bacterium]
MGIAVGIDLGTTNSCVAVVEGERARVVENEDDQRIQPSIVSLPSDGSTVAGWAAKDRLILDPANTFYSFKRLLGRNFDDADLAKALRGLSYGVAAGPDGIPVVRSRERDITLPELSAMMLRHLREMSVATLGTEIRDAVITVPANFNDVQRSSTKVAGRIAGFNVLRILNEPTAAALAYGFGGAMQERIAVYDFGGGTFDITIIELMDDIFEVLATAGDTFLGGDDIDEIIAAEMRAVFLREHRIELGADPIAKQRVRTVAERIKCQLSTLDEVQATLRELAHDPAGRGIDFGFTLTRKRFEQLIGALVEKSFAVCDEAFKLARLDRSALDNMVLVGGTTRVPLVRRKVEEYFGRTARTEINPDEVVAIGAAIHAFSLTGEALPAGAAPARPKRPRGGTMLGRSGPQSLISDSAPLAPGAGASPKMPLTAPFVAPPKTQRTVHGLAAPLLGLPRPPVPDRAQEPMELDSDLLEELPQEPSDWMIGAHDPPALAPFVAVPLAPPPPLDLVGGEPDVPVLPDARESFSVPMVTAKAAPTLLLDVTPQALGVATAGGYCDTVIERNAAIPVEQSRLFTTSTDGQTEVSIDIYQGESRRIGENTRLGSVVLSGVRPAPRGEIKIRVSFDIDTDGILGVSASNEETGEAQATRINLTGGLSEDRVSALVRKYSKP